MELKQKTADEKLIFLFDRIEQRSVVNTVRKIMEIFMKDDEYQRKCFEWLSDNELPCVAPKRIPITLHLSTFGGGCHYGLSLYDIIVSSSTPVEIVCSGGVMSMGVVILLAANVRRAYRNTTFLIHQVSGLTIGSLQEIEESVESIKRLNERIFQIIVEKTKITREQLDVVKQNKTDWYLTAQEALDAGIITEIID